MTGVVSDDDDGISVTGSDVGEDVSCGVGCGVDGVVDMVEGGLS